VGLLTENVEETRSIPAVRNLVLAASTDKATPGGVAVQLGEAIFDAMIAEQNGQQDNRSQAWDGIIVAALAAGGLEAVDPFAGRGWLGGLGGGR
jgi:hypothetical protein